jgi:hypothetical protein
MRYFNRALYLLILVTWLLLSCSSSLPSRYQDKPRSLTQGELIYLARYNPCACGMGDAQFSIELSPISKEDFEELMAKLLTLTPTSLVMLPSKLRAQYLGQQILNTPVQETSASDQSLSIDLNQSALMALMIRQHSSKDKKIQRYWERVELTSVRLLKRAQTTQDKEQALQRSPPSMDHQDTPDLTMGDLPERLDEENQRHLRMWRNIWRWWPKNPHLYLVLRVNLNEYSRRLTGHILHRGDFIDLEVIPKP